MIVAFTLFLSIPCFKFNFASFHRILDCFPPTPHTPMHTHTTPHTPMHTHTLIQTPSLTPLLDDTFLGCHLSCLLWFFAIEIFNLRPIISSSLNFNTSSTPPISTLTKAIPIFLRGLCRNTGISTTASEESFRNFVKSSSVALNGKLPTQQDQR